MHHFLSHIPFSFNFLSFSDDVQKGLIFHHDVNIVVFFIVF